MIDSGEWPWRDDARSAASTLYRNLGDGTFRDVTASTGFRADGYGMGVAVGDYDGDGRIDVFVTALGGNTLLRNTPLGFLDVTEQMGVAGEAAAWSTSAAFLDYDRDGDLDLFVTNYVTWSPEIDRAVDYRLTGSVALMVRRPISRAPTPFSIAMTAKDSRMYPQPLV